MLVYIGDYSKMGVFLQYIFKNNTLDILKFIFCGVDYCVDKESIVINSFKSENESVIYDNLMHKTLFVVNDLNLFKSNLSNKGFIVNEGLQKWRGQINSISSFLSSIDSDYRESLYNHNKIFTSSNRFLSFGKNIEPLVKSIFSYKNIHLNLGNVRWYSTS